MLSIPPATTTSFTPNWIDCAASIVAETIKINNTSPLNAISQFSTKRETTRFNLKKSEPFIPEEQTLLIVVQITELGIPAPNAACLAGAWPKFALRTLPKKPLAQVKDQHLPS